MKYQDRVYGEIEIVEPVVLELMEAPAMQRLKLIDSAGYSEPYFPGSKRNRFDHSVGVYALLKKFGATLEEQLAGLLHDISHSAFSHCIDYVLEGGSQTEHTHQDDIFDEFVGKTEIPGILKKYGLDAEFILNDKNFPLKEKNLPDICADRIDYIFRDALAYGVTNQNELKYFLDNLTVQDSGWIFKDFASAWKFAQMFDEMNRIHYSGLQSALMHRTVGDYLKYALQEGYIEEAELYLTDQVVMDKINVHLEEDEKLRLLWDRMNYRIKSENNLEDFDTHVFCKSRVVDPFCLHEGKVQRISQIDPSWKEVLERESKPKEYFIKFGK